MEDLMVISHSDLNLNALYQIDNLPDPVIKKAINFGKSQVKAAKRQLALDIAKLNIEERSIR